MDLGPASLSAILLAAGTSSRSLAGNKLLLPGPRGRPVLRQVAEVFCGLGLGEVLLVTGHEAERVRAAVEGLPLRFVQASDYALGMGHSLAAGLRAASPGARGFLVSPCYLPFLEPEPVRAVVDCFLRQGGLRHVIPLQGGQRGHPVAICADLRASLEALQGDQGARQLLGLPQERARTEFLVLTQSSIHRDNDRGEATAG